MNENHNTRFQRSTMILTERGSAETCVLTTDKEKIPQRKTGHEKDTIHHAASLAASFTLTRSNRPPAIPSYAGSRHVRCSAA